VLELCSTWSAQPHNGAAVPLTIPLKGGGGSCLACIWASNNTSVASSPFAPSTISQGHQSNRHNNDQKTKALLSLTPTQTSDVHLPNG